MACWVAFREPSKEQQNGHVQLFFWRCPLEKMKPHNSTGLSGYQQAGNGWKQPVKLCQAESSSHTSRAAFQQLGGVVQICEVIVFIATCRYGSNIWILRIGRCDTKPRKVGPTLKHLETTTENWGHWYLALSTGALSAAWGEIFRIELHLESFRTHHGVAPQTSSGSPPCRNKHPSFRRSHRWFEATSSLVNVMFWFHQSEKRCRIWPLLYPKPETLCFFQF
jgi:hypothetical protein